MGAVGWLVGWLAGWLARFRVYRPLLVVLTATVALWDLGTTILPMAWYWALLVGAVLFALAYTLFAWVSRIRNFILAVVVAVVMVVIVRFVLVA